MSFSILRTRLILTGKQPSKYVLKQQGSLRGQTSAFVSRGFVSKNVENVKKEEVAAIQKLDNVSKTIRSQEEFPKITKHEANMVIQEPEDSKFKESDSKPIVLVFGWGGASHKNLGKYSSIYLGAGFTTVQYILPTRHIFRDTAQIPELMDNLLMQLEKEDIYERPVYVHCLSDTGVMCYQGMDVVRKQSSKMKRMNLHGVVWDSCCGPRPEVTVGRVIALLGVNWFCCLRDGMGMMLSLNSTYRLLRDRGWPGLIERWQGKHFELSLIEGTWSGDFGKDHFRNFPTVPELFVYSNKDYYLPDTYLEKNVLEPRKEMGANFTAVKFTGSSHVAHIRQFREEYQSQVLSFLNMKREQLKTMGNSEKESKDKFLEHSLQPKFL